MNKPELKLAMAKLLPKHIVISSIKPDVYIWSDHVQYSDAKIRETEWLYVMHLIEQGLTPDEQVHYFEQLAGSIMNDAYDGVGYWKQSRLCSEQLTWLCDFNQRAEAMCKLKGIEIL